MTTNLHKLAILVTGKISKKGVKPTEGAVCLVYQRVGKNKGNLGNVGKYGYQLREEKPRIDRKSARQLVGREKLKAATVCWKGLSISERQAWKSKASAMAITGFNLFVSRHIRGELDTHG